MYKILYYYHNKLYFYLWKNTNIGIFKVVKLFELTIFNIWLKYATKYIIQLYFVEMYNQIKNYDNKDTKYILYFPKKIIELCYLGYLTHRVYMGPYAKLKNKITLQEVLMLNPNKKDKVWTNFLKEYMFYCWENTSKRITKNKLDIMYFKYFKNEG